MTAELDIIHSTELLNTGQSQTQQPLGGLREKRHSTRSKTTMTSASSHSSSTILQNEYTSLCAWCKLIIRLGGNYITHSICPECTELLS